MAVLTNTMLQGTAADVGETSYEISKSLRLNAGDKPRLVRKGNSAGHDGNRRIYTFSFWFKIGSAMGTNRLIYDTGSGAGGDSSMDGGIELTSNDNFRYFDNEGATVDCTTTAVLRDPSAWYHAVVSHDSLHPVESDRVRIYINGVIQALSTETMPTLGRQTGFFKGYENSIIGNGTDEYFDGEIAEFTLIEAEALSCYYFGEFDSAGVWQPKIHGYPKINKGTTWSTTTTGADGWNGSNAIGRGFDGDPSREAEGDTDNESIVLPIDVTIGKGGVRVHGAWTSSNYGVVKLYNGSTLVEEFHGAASGGRWWSVKDYANSRHYHGPITKIDISRNGSKPSFLGIEVNGQVLIDGTTDPSTRVDWNIAGIDWKHTDYWTNEDSSIEDIFNSEPFRGYDEDNMGRASGTSTATFTPPAGSLSGVKTVRISGYFENSNNTSAELLWVNGTVVPMGGTVLGPKHFDVDVSGTGLTSVAFAYISGSNPYAYVGEIKCDGVPLRGLAYDQSFYLKFKDSGTKGRLGQSEIMNKSAVSGALPIYDTDGSVNADSNKANLKLAIPGFDDSDHSATVKGSGSNRSLTMWDQNGNYRNSDSYEKSKFYGKALHLGGNQYSLKTDVSSDFTVGTGNWTVECWVRPHSSFSDSWILWTFGDGTSAKYTGVRVKATNDGYRLYNASASDTWDFSGTELSSGTRSADKWEHLAVTRDGSTWRIFVNGILKDTHTSSATVYQNTNQITIGQGANTERFRGWIQDFRFYNTCKYTSSFAIPNRWDWSKVENLTNESSPAFSDFYNSIEYTGNNTNNRAITGVGFQPDCVFWKRTDSTGNWRLSDVMRGTNGDEYLYPDLDSSEDQDSNGIKSFDADGFTLGTDSNLNGSSVEIYSICLKAGGAPSSNTDGSITAQVSAHPTGCFSMATWTGTGSAATVGHGLGKQPTMIWVKNRDTAADWQVYHHHFGLRAGERAYKDALQLNEPDVVSTAATYWNDTYPDSKTFTIGTHAGVNTSGDKYIAYIFSDTEGLVHTDFYEGINGGNAQINTPFPVQWALFKSVNQAGQEWVVKDTTRGGTKTLNLHDNQGQATNRQVTFNDTNMLLASGSGATNGGAAYSYVYLGFGKALALTKQDVLNDSPTNYEDSDGGIHGGFCTWNPLASVSNNASNLSSFEQSNLKGTTHNSSTSGALGTLGVSSGKWYWEITYDSKTGGTGLDIGAAQNDLQSTIGNSEGCGQSANGYVYRNSGHKANNNSASSYGASYTFGDVIGVALDLDNSQITFYKNGATQGVAYSSMNSGTYFPCCGDYNDSGTSTFTANFGAGGFKYTPPANHLALCTQNLDDTFSGDEVNNPSKYFDTKIWSGTGADRKIPLNFGADLIWTKRRSGAGSHRITPAFDLTKHITSDTATAAIGTQLVNSVDSDGVNIDSNDDINNSSHTFVGWFWDAGTAANTSNLDTGNVTPSAQWVNPTAGCSITKINTGSSVVDANFAHNLGAKPAFCLCLNSSSDVHKYVWWDAFPATNNYLILNIQNDVGVNSSGVVWNNTDPTNTLFHDTFGNTMWGQNQDMWYFMWSEIPGFSKFGTYTGNGNSNGPLINLGFRPKFFMLKEHADGTDWFVLDGSRSPSNEAKKSLMMNDDDAEVTNGNFVDFVSNGVKFRTDGGAVNGDGDLYYYAAFAEHPFKTARAK